MRIMAAIIAVLFIFAVQSISFAEEAELAPQPDPPPVETVEPAPAPEPEMSPTEPVENVIGEDTAAPAESSEIALPDQGETEAVESAVPSEIAPPVVVEEVKFPPARPIYGDNAAMYDLLLSAVNTAGMHETRSEYKQPNPELEELVNSLYESCETDRDRIYAVFYWVADNIYYNEAAHAPDYATGSVTHHPDEVFAVRATTCMGYANLCVKMLDLMGIPNTILETYNISSRSATPDQYARTHSCNAAFDGQNWIIFDSDEGSSNKYYGGNFVYGGVSAERFDIPLGVFSQRQRILWLSNRIMLNDWSMYNPRMTAGGLSMNPAGQSGNNAPNGVAAERLGETHVKIEWEEVANASGYYVYRSLTKSGGYENIGAVRDPKMLSFYDVGLDGGQIYYYKTVAFFKSAKETIRGVSSQPSYGLYIMYA